MLIGFAAGYWVGTRQGRQGLDRTVDSGEGLAAATPLADFLGKGGKNRSFAVIRGVLDDVIDRRAGSGAKAA